MFKNFIPLWLLLASLCCTTFHLQAQKASFDELFSVNLRDAGALYDQDRQVTGYYLFYETDKVGKDRKYTLQLLDQNLEKIGQKTITASKNMFIQSGVYNGELLAIKTLDAKEEESKLYLFNASGEVVRTEKLAYSFMDNPRYAQQMESMGFTPLHPVEGGFVVYRNDKKGGVMSKTMYEAEFIPNDKATASWSVSSDKKRKEFVVGNFLTAYDGILYTVESSLKGIMDTDVHMVIIGQDLATGKELFRHKLGGKNPMMPMQALGGAEGVTVCGPYVGAGESITKDRPEGLMLFTLNKEGERTNSNTISWQKDLSKFVEVDNKGRIKDQGNLMILNVSRQADDRYIITTEGYKVFNGAVTVKDIFMMEVDKDFALEKVESFEKKATTANLVRGISMASPVSMGYLALGSGLFGYRYTQIDEDMVVTGYVDRSSDGLGTISYLDGEFKTDQISYTPKVTEVEVLPAKPGYVLILEYFKKDKKLDLRLEKINI